MLVPCSIISCWWFPVPSVARLYRFSDLCMIFLLKCNQLSFQKWRDKYFLRILFHLNLSDKIRQAAITVYFQVYLRSLPFAQPAYGSAIPCFWMYVGLYRNGCFVHRTTAQTLVFDRRAGVCELGIGWQLHCFLNATKSCSIVNIKQEKVIFFVNILDAYLPNYIGVNLMMIRPQENVSLSNRPFKTPTTTQ